MAWLDVDLNDVVKLFVEALSVEGASHKQWYLWKIAVELGIDLSDQWNEEYPEPEKGTVL